MQSAGRIKETVAGMHPNNSINGMSKNKINVPANNSKSGYLRNTALPFEYENGRP